MRVSLDVESVLANTFGRFIDVYNTENQTSYTVADIDSWDWVAEEVEFAEFMRILETEWAENPLTIEPLEAELDATVTRLAEHHAVDVVTATPGPGEQVQSWLDHHGITEYEDFVLVDPQETSKAELDYHLYIDDKPHLADKLGEGQHQYLVKHGWNETHWEHEKTEPVDTVADAVETILATDDPRVAR